ncbi:MAG: tRNA glutamyl-Q(34) synthetase GluQRS [Mariprofundaceae bacterium]|nr:tRNA glutamyl-Q(34) synthetase GluQRS [Mariprofundaceae bacterium]
MKTRFAPSPTGFLHIGNIYSAYQCQDWARKNHAKLILRIEDIDHTRCRPPFSQAIITDLTWLGFTWDEETLYQQSRKLAYQQALQKLKNLELIYPCTCTRAQIKKTLENHQKTYPYADPYQGTCRENKHSHATQNVAWRLNIHKAMQHINKPLYWYDYLGKKHPVHAQEYGDVILARKDIGTSYHLAVVIDDAFQQITHVIRGQDLESFTGIHRILQALLDLPSLSYTHHGLLYAPNDEKWSKQDKAPSIQKWRSQGWDAAHIRHYIDSLGSRHEH